MKVSSITKNQENPVIGIEPDKPLNDAVAKMVEHRIGALVVIENDALIGIISERDLLSVLHEKSELWSPVCVRDVMTAKPIVCDPENTLEEVMTMMVDNNVRHLPLMHDGELKGMLTITDIVEELLNKAKFENKLLKNYIQNWPDGDQLLGPDA
jgi:CBS domain-containing protein